MRIFSQFFSYLFLVWHRFVSPTLPQACRHEPSCSVYAAEALRRYGLFKGAWLGAKRLARCQPWGSAGYDPVP